MTSRLTPQAQAIRRTHGASQNENCHQSCNRGVTDGLADNDNKNPQASNSNAAVKRSLSTVHHQSEIRPFRARDIMGLIFFLVLTRFRIHFLKSIQSRDRLLKSLAPASQNLETDQSLPQQETSKTTGSLSFAASTIAWLTASFSVPEIS